jgi:hypothetical protein
MDVALLSPIEHRGEQAQLQLMLVRSRDALVRNRTQLINHIRGTVKSFGARLPSGISATAFGHKATDHLPEALRPVLEEMVVLVARITEQIQRFEEEIERWVEAHPEAKVLMAVPGVGPLTAMAFVLTLEDPHRFRRSREAGAYLGLVPRRHGSGKRDPELGITKTGDTHVRRLLVQCAHHMMRKKGQDTDLRRWGLKLAARGSEEREETRGRRGGAQAGGVAPSTLGHRSRVRPAAPSPPSGRLVRTRMDLTGQENDQLEPARPGRLRRVPRSEQETACQIAAPRRVGLQHAPGPEEVLLRVRIEACGKLILSRAVRSIRRRTEQRFGWTRSALS